MTTTDTRKLEIQRALRRRHSPVYYVARDVVRVTAVLVTGYAVFAMWIWK